MLRATGITRRFGGLVALQQVDIAVGAGQLVGLIGPNGSGKSTLFNVIAGALRPDAGRVSFDGRDITGWQAHAVARLGVGRTFQIPRPFESLAAVENVQVGVLYGQGRRRGPEARRSAEELLAFVGLAQRADTPVRDFTLAEKKRLEIARALSIRPRLLLLDEVFAGLNPAEVDSAIELIFRMRDELGVAILMVEHVLKALMETCERVVVLSYGEKIAEGTPSEVIANPEVVRVYLGSAYAAG